MGEGKPFMPVILLRSAEDSQILFESLIGSLTSPIGLRVIRCTDVLMDIEKATEFCGKFGCEADISVRNDFAGNAVMWDHVSGVEQCHSFRVDALGAGEEYRGFGTVCVCDGKNSVVSS